MLVIDSDKIATQSGVLVRGRKPCVAGTLWTSAWPCGTIEQYVENLSLVNDRVFITLDVLAGQGLSRLNFVDRTF